jgi:hypothetical protein
MPFALGGEKDAPSFNQCKLGKHVFVHCNSAIANIYGKRYGKIGS